jgi:hypothetical protein
MPRSTDPHEHPELGIVEIDCQNLSSEDGRQRLQFFTAAAGSPAVEQSQLLGVIGSFRL